MKIRVYKIVESSLVNGPGRRFVLWVQGCLFNCPGCFNQEARAWEGGVFLSTDKIMAFINEQDVEGITISGGEPFMQAEAVAELLSKCREKELNTLVYSGFQYCDLKKEIIPGSVELLKETDLLLDGPYDKNCTPNGEWTGSGNQRAISLSKEGRAMKKRRRNSIVEQEYIISPEGELLLTGI